MLVMRSWSEAYDDGGHVVAAESRHGVLGEEFIEHFLHNGSISLALTDFLLDQVDQPLAVLHVLLPNAVTTYDYELVLQQIALHFLDIRISSDHLLVPT
jgi:hypothetical protein